MLKAEDASDDEDGEKKKKKAKKGGIGKEMLKIDRNYLVEKLMKKASPYFHVFDEQNGVDIFKYFLFIFSGMEHSREFRSLPKKSTTKTSPESWVLSYSSYLRIKPMIKYMDSPIPFKLNSLAVSTFKTCQAKTPVKKSLFMEHFWTNWKKSSLRSMNFQINSFRLRTNSTKRKRTDLCTKYSISLYL